MFECRIVGGCFSIRCVIWKCKMELQRVSVSICGYSKRWVGIRAKKRKKVKEEKEWKRGDNGQAVIARSSQAKMKYLQFHRVPGLQALTPFVWKWVCLLFSERRGDQREGERGLEMGWREGGQTDWLSEILWFLPMLLEGLGPGCFSAAHMDKINLCVYDRLIYTPVSTGAGFLVVKPFVCYWHFFPYLSFLSLFISISAFLQPSPTAGTALILDPGLLSAR